jgi:hypothetical protein
MLFKNVSNDDIVEYNCGYGNIVTVKKGNVVEIASERAAKNFLRLLTPLVEVTDEEPTPVAKPKEKKVEKPKDKKTLKKK